MAAREVRHRPIVGGVFGAGRYEMATMPCIAHGLHAVRHMVVEPRAGRVLSMSLDKREALTSARKLIRAATVLSQAEGTTSPNVEQIGLWTDEELPSPPMIPRSVSRRRREVFTKSGGVCHYCSTTLELQGQWHVEHQMPRALGGSDELTNLVASCTRCNLEKGDLTAIEYVIKQPYAGN